MVNILSLLHISVKNGVCQFMFVFSEVQVCSLNNLRSTQRLTHKKYQNTWPKTALALFWNDGLKDFVAILWIVVFGFPPDKFWVIQDVIDVEMRLWIVPNTKNTVTESTLSTGCARLCSSWNFLSTFLRSAAPFPALPEVQPRGAIACSSCSGSSCCWLPNNSH